MADVNKNKGKKIFCTKHPKQYALNSGLCCHPDCMESLIWTHAKRRRGIKNLWMKIKKKGLRNEFISYLWMELLSDQAKGKPAFINTIWLLFRIRRYWFKNIREDCTFDQVPQQAREKARDRGLVNVVNDVLVAESMRYEMGNDERYEFGNPEKAVWVNELNEWIINEYGEDIAAYFNGHIDKNDIRKMRRWGVSHTLIELRRIKNEIAEWVKAQGDIDGIE